jgi:hypothetical protein
VGRREIKDKIRGCRLEKEGEGRKKKDGGGR